MSTALGHRPAGSFRPWPRRAPLVRAFALLLALAGPAAAQQDQRPSTERPPEPELLEPAGPALQPPTPVTPETLPRPEPPRVGPAVRVERFEFEGNTALDDETLRAALADLTGRPLDGEDLLAARDRITRLYVEQGYATSGALLPDQPVGDGRVRLRIVEGRLEEVRIEGARRFAEGYLRARLLRAGRAPLDVRRIEARLQRLQRDPLIEQVTARLEPLPGIGRSRLVLSIVEARQEDLRLEAANDRSPSVGEETGAFFARAANLIGQRDELRVSGWFTEGLRDVEARVRLPINALDTRLEASVRWSHSRIVEFPFDPLDIESESLTLSVGVTQPVLRTRHHSVDVGLRGDWRKGRSTLDGRLFCFQPGVVDCTPTIAVLRLIADWRWQQTDQALSARSMLSWGTGWLGATTRPGNVPDGRFVAWLGQLQLARRLPWGSRGVARLDLQLANDPLLGFERIAVGGARTVRGYRPNQLVRDNGLDVSLEWRVPVWRRPLGEPVLSLAPFFDVGHAWNERFDEADETIASVGLGLLARPHERVEAEAWWGARLIGVDRVGSGLIDEGIHLRVSVDVW